MNGMRVDRKGRVTIPADIRDRAGLLPGSAVEFEQHGVRFPAPSRESGNPG
jgi:AbrB family looped-hinge helix DNA binding protein